MLDSTNFPIKNENGLLDNNAVRAWMSYWYMFQPISVEWKLFNNRVDNICLLDRVYKIQYDLKDVYEILKQNNKFRIYEDTQRLYPDGRRI